MGRAEVSRPAPRCSHRHRRACAAAQPPWSATSHAPAARNSSPAIKSCDGKTAGRGGALLSLLSPTRAARAVPRSSRALQQALHAWPLRGYSWPWFERHIPAPACPWNSAPAAAATSLACSSEPRGGGCAPYSERPSSPLSVAATAWRGRRMASGEGRGGAAQLVCSYPVRGTSYRETSPK